MGPRMEEDTMRPKGCGSLEEVGAWGKERGRPQGERASVEGTLREDVRGEGQKLRVHEQQLGIGGTSRTGDSCN